MSPVPIILQVSDDTDHRIAGSLTDHIDWRTHGTDVAGVDDESDVPILRRDGIEDRDRIVRGCIVDEDVLVAAAAQARHHRPDAIVNLADVRLFVEGRGDHAECLHGLDFS